MYRLLTIKVMLIYFEPKVLVLTPPLTIFAAITAQPPDFTRVKTVLCPLVLTSELVVLRKKQIHICLWPFPVSV